MFEASTSKCYAMSDPVSASKKADGDKACKDYSSSATLVTDWTFWCNQQEFILVGRQSVSHKLIWDVAVME